MDRRVMWVQAVLMVLLSGVALGYSTGPDPRYTGAPGDAPEACTACHTGTLSSGSGSARVEVRLASDPSRDRAGDLSSTDANTQAICDGAPKPCSAGQAQFVEHQLAGMRIGTRTVVGFEFDWKAAVGGSGQVVFYVAGNAANGWGGASVTVPPTSYEVKMLVGDIAGLADRVDQYLNTAGKPAAFLSSTENGMIAGWNRDADATNAITVVDNSGPGAVYRGLALGLGVNGPMLCAANFRAWTIDGRDASFKPATVTCAKHNESKKHAVAGDGNGLVNVFDLEGNLKIRLVTNGVLNAPWGMAMAPPFFGDFSNTLLVGNFGDGRIHAFDIGSGELIGTLLLKNGNPAAIEGLWGLAIGNGRSGGDASTLDFTAGVSGGGAKEDHGIFGSISVAQ